MDIRFIGYKKGSDIIGNEREQAFKYMDRERKGKGKRNETQVQSAPLLLFIVMQLQEISFK